MSTLPKNSDNDYSLPVAGIFSLYWVVKNKKEKRRRRRRRKRGGCGVGKIQAGEGGRRIFAWSAKSKIFLMWLFIEKDAVA